MSTSTAVSTPSRTGAPVSAGSRERPGSPGWRSATVAASTPAMSSSVGARSTAEAMTSVVPPPARSGCTITSGTWKFSS
ncbi:MAG: hypothetical protein U0S36_13400 [Candidatus Nanopelagicales bacterium]